MRHVSSESRSRTAVAIRRTSPSVVRRTPACASSLNSSDSCCSSSGSGIGSRSSRRNQLQVGEHVQQRDQLRRVLGHVLARHVRHQAAQQPRRLLGPLDVAAEPEQVVGHAARQLRVETLAPHAEARRRQQRHGGHRPVRDDPRVLAPAPALHRHDRDVAGRADTGQSAGHDRHRVAGRRHVHAQHELPRLRVLCRSTPAPSTAPLRSARRSPPAVPAARFAAAPFCSALSVRPNTGCRVAGGNDGLITSSSRCASTYCRSSGCPHHHDRAGDRSSSSPRRRRHNSGRNAAIAGRLDDPRTERVGHGDVARANGFHQAGDAERGIGPQLQRIAEAVVEPAEDHVHLAQPFERLDEDAAVAHGQVRRLRPA